MKTAYVAFYKYTLKLLGLFYKYISQHFVGDYLSLPWSTPAVGVPSNYLPSFEGMIRYIQTTQSYSHTIEK